MSEAIGHNTGESNAFIVAMAPAAARRQLKISIAVATAFIAASLLVLATGAIQPRTGQPANVKLTIQMPGSITMHQAKNTQTQNFAARRGI